jgi:uncharacterized RDD family membrane protein YckC
MTKKFMSQSDAEQNCTLPRRLAAVVYDGLLLVGLWMLAAAAVVIPLNASVDPANGWFQLYLLLVAWLYFAFSWRGGHTLGMKAWHIRLVAPEQPVGWLTTLMRFSVAIASWLVFGLGFLWSLGHPRRATWHDLASGTALVVDKSPRPSRADASRSRSPQKPDGKQEDDQAREQRR